MFEPLLPGVALEVLARDGEGWRGAGRRHHRAMDELSRRLPDLDDDCWRQPWVPFVNGGRIRSAYASVACA